jgi:predicted DNA-binding protein (UPF0278 family)
MNIHYLAEDAICFDGQNPYILDGNQDILVLSSLRELLETEKEIITKLRNPYCSEYARGCLECQERLITRLLAELGDEK